MKIFIKYLIFEYYFDFERFNENINQSNSGKLKSFIKYII